MPIVDAQNGTIRIDLVVKAGAKTTAFTGVRDAIVNGRSGMSVCVSVAAPPTDDQANRELVRFFGKVFGVPQRCVTIARGERSRFKAVSIDGITVTDAQRALQAAMVRDSVHE